MKPYGGNGKVEMASCGCCPAHDMGMEFLPCRNVKIKYSARKILKHRARRKAKQEIDNLIQDGPLV